MNADPVAELLTMRRERKRFESQAAVAALVVGVGSIIGAIVDWSSAWQFFKSLSGLWAMFYVFRSMLAWHRIEKAGRS